MESAEFLGLVGHRYSNPRVVSPGIFSADMVRGDERLAVHFFDFTTELDRIDFDLQSYQAALLSDEFYSNPGALQWNYYLHFVCSEDTFHKLDQAGISSSIERDELFARKEVTTVSRLRNEGQRPLGKVPESAERPQDPTIGWIDSLRSIDLDGVFLGTIARTKVVERYLSGNPIKEERDKTTQAAVLDKFDNFQIRSVSLKKYRDYPETRGFSFAPVTLIYGANGVGKTSLLEAIEYWCCGKTKRDPQLAANKYQIGVQTDNQSEVNWTSNRTAKLFRDRDLRWYGNYYKNGNRLEEGFNRFNLFNTDAAVTMARDKARGADITEALASLVLGESANIIEEEIKQIEKLFQNKYREIGASISTIRAQIKDGQEQIKTLKKSPSDKSLDVESLQDAIYTAGWTGRKPTNRKDSQDRFSVQIDEALLEFAELEELLDDLRGPTRSKVKNELTEMQRLQVQVISAIKDIADKSDQIRLMKQDALESDDCQKRLDKLGKYVSDKSSLHLKDVSRRLELLRLRLRDFTEIQSMISDIDLEQYVRIDEPILQFQSKLARRRQSVVADENRRKREIEQFEEKQGRIAKLSEEIRSIGRDIVAADATITECPLCGFDYKADELSDRINRDVSSLESTDLVKSAMDQLGALVKEHNELDRQIADIKNIQRATELRLAEENEPNLPLSDSATMLLDLDAILIETNGHIQQESKIAEHFELIGLSEQEFFDLSQWFTAQYPSEGLPNYEDRESFESIRREATVEFDELGSRLKNLEAELGKATLKLERILKKELNDVNIDDASDEILDRLDQIGSALELYASIAKKLSIPDDETLKNTVLRANRIYRAWMNFSEDQKDAERIGELRDNARRKIDNARQQLVVASEKNDRVVRAISVLTKIMDDPKEQHLSEYLKANLDSIRTIFSKIHVPREFTSFNVENGQIILEDMLGKRRKIEHVSSGQRTALTLSIFLTLNQQARQAPKLLVFDDPVAYVDDLNTLAFFDYLREIAIVGERQVVFATANSKLANLFDKKFEMFGDSYRRHDLLRDVTTISRA